MRPWFAAASAALLFTAAARPAHALQPDATASLVAALTAKASLSTADLIALASLPDTPGDDLAGLDGKPFRVVLTPTQTAAAEGPRSWYDDAHQTLDLHAPVAPLSGQFFRLPGCPAKLTTARGIEINRSRLDRAAAGGADAMIDTVEERRISLGGLVCGRPTTASGLNVDVYENRARAQRQLGSLEVTIEGRLRSVDGRSMVTCEGEQMAAPRRARTELVIHQCVVGATISQIAFTAGGVELARWAPATNRARPRIFRSAIHVPRLLDLH